MSPRSLSLLLSLAAVTCAGASPDLASGWAQLERFRSVEAQQAFERAAASRDPATAREARFGRAVSLLVKQPVSAAQVDEARRGLAELAAGGLDDPALGARYFLGRIAEYYQEQPDEAEAARQFRLLIAAGPGSQWAQTALTRLAILQIYALDPGLAPAARIAAAEKLLGAARAPAAQSDLHLVLADAIFYYRLPVAGALPHLLAAESLGCLDGPTRADVLVQIAEVSSLCGDPARARVFYSRFLGEFPLDQRRYAVARRLAALGGAR
jgi:hypothetical protein